MSVRVEKNGAVWTAIQSRAEARNAVDPQTAEALVDAFNDFNRDPQAAVAVLWGEGGSFCAGFDLKTATALTDDSQPMQEIAYPLDDRPPPRGPMGPTRLELDKPVIAAIAGPAVAGGFELALWCDLRVMEASAYFGVYCRRWGVPLIDGGTVRLPRLIGLSRALDLILTGRPVAAEEALQLGLVNRVVKRGTARQEAEALARQVASFPQGCMKADRLSAHLGWELELSQALHQEFDRGMENLVREGLPGAERFAKGAGRHGSFE